ncbi:hypothetical protein KQX54_006475, partial [Cotesia glomerata]
GQNGRRWRQRGRCRKRESMGTAPKRQEALSMNSIDRRLLWRSRDIGTHSRITNRQSLKCREPVPIRFRSEAARPKAGDLRASNHKYLSSSLTICNRLDRLLLSYTIPCAWNFEWEQKNVSLDSGIRDRDRVRGMAHISDTKKPALVHV